MKKYIGASPDFSKIKIIIQVEKRIKHFLQKDNQLITPQLIFFANNLRNCLLYTTFSG